MLKVKPQQPMQQLGPRSALHDNVILPLKRERERRKGERTSKTKRDWDKFKGQSSFSGGFLRITSPSLSPLPNLQ